MTNVLAVAHKHADALITVDGVVGVMIGGSHARGTADAGSDLDLGVYYSDPLDVDAMQRLASDLVGRLTEVAAPGGWGPWVNGGAWLDVETGRVDWILRDLGRVSREWERARQGEFSVHHQPGHPFGFVSTIYVGELAMGRAVADPSGRLAELQAAASTYPERLREAFEAWLWEAEFSLAVAGKQAGRGDAAYVAMCVTHAVGIMAYAVHARAGRWVVNEKGLVDEAGRLATAPEGFAGRAHGVCAGAAEWAGLARRLDGARELLADLRAAR